MEKKKRKISVRRILQVLVTLIVTSGCIVAMTAASRIRDDQKLAGIDIRIRNSKYGFIDKEEIKALLLSNRHIDLGKTSLRKLDVRQMEGIVDANPWIDDAQVYVDNRHVLHVNVTQRVPMARLFETDGNSYYLDHTLKSMPLSERYIHYTTVVTNVPVMKQEDSAAMVLKANIVALVKFIEKDSFWNAQVSQIIVGEDKTFELVPILGNHRIRIGDTTNMQKKFNNLFAFYNKVLNRIGWNKYEVLDLRYDGQLVASPALPWKKPVDNMTNINWVNSIVNADEKAAESDTPAAVMPATVNAAMASTNTAKPVLTTAANTVQPTAPVEKPTPKPVQPTAAVKPAVKPQEKTVQKTVPVVAKPVVKVEARKENIKPAAKTTTVTKQLPKQAVKKEEAKEKPKTVTAKKEPEKKVEKEVKQEQKKETAPKYIYQGTENNNQQ
jgi:cell division protein FtsQ